MIDPDRNALRRIFAAVDRINKMADRAAVELGRSKQKIFGYNVGRHWGPTFEPSRRDVPPEKRTNDLWECLSVLISIKKKDGSRLFDVDDIRKARKAIERYDQGFWTFNRKSNPGASLAKRDDCREALERLILQRGSSAAELTDFDAFLHFLGVTIVSPRIEGRFHEAIKAAVIIDTVLSADKSFFGFSGKIQPVARMNVLIRGARAAALGDQDNAEKRLLFQMKKLSAEYADPVIPLRLLTHQGYREGSLAPFQMLSLLSDKPVSSFWGYGSKVPVKCGALHNGARRAVELGAELSVADGRLGGLSPDQAWSLDLELCVDVGDFESAVLTIGAWANALIKTGKSLKAVNIIDRGDALLRQHQPRAKLAAMTLATASGLLHLNDLKRSKSYADKAAAFNKAMQHLTPALEFYAKKGLLKNTRVIHGQITEALKSSPTEGELFLSRTE